jgi:CRP/FNR family transcriptional regulator, transcriptional activator FtrB
MADDDLDSLYRLPLFEELGPEYREQLLRPALTQCVSAGENLFSQGDRAEYLHVLIEGAVELKGSDRAGNEVVVEVIQPVENFILAAVVTDAPYLMAARTLQDSRLVLIPAEHLRGELYRVPALALLLLGSLAHHYRSMVRQIKDLKLRTSAERIAAFLLSLTREETGAGMVELPYMKRVFAKRMGMTPENLSRAFASLRERGVRMDGSRIIIEDVEKLADFCRIDTVIDGVERGLRVPGQRHAPPLEPAGEGINGSPNNRTDLP